MTLANITPEQLQAALALLAEQQATNADPTPIDSLPKASRYASMGYVVTGDGKAPEPGTIMAVPTKAGKVRRVEIVQVVDTSEFDGVKVDEWAATYRNLK
jgi:hypothetical protein